MILGELSAQGAVSLALLDNERQHALQRLRDFALGRGVEGSLGGSAGTESGGQKAVHLQT
jgi:hypothetical protein